MAPILVSPVRGLIQVGTSWNFNNSASFGTGPIYLLSCNGGTLQEESGFTGLTIPNSFINYSTGTSTLNLVGDSAPGVTFSGPWVMSGGGGGAGGGTYTTTAPLASYGPVNISSGGSLANLVTISGDISGTNVVTKIGVGTVTLSGANDFSGTLAVNNGTLELASSGSINSVSTLFVATNGASGIGTLDVSAYPTYTLSSSTTLAANGNGDGSGGSPATIIGGTTVDLGSQPINLTWTGGGTPQSSPSLYIAPGTTLKLNGNVITVNNASPAALGPGFYALIRVSDGSSGTITGTPNVTANVTGTGLLPGCNAAIQIGSPVGDASDVVLSVTASSTLVTIAPFAAVNHGTAPSITVTVSPDPTGASGGPGTVTFKTNGVAIVVSAANPVHRSQPGGLATFADASLRKPCGPHLLCYRQL